MPSTYLLKSTLDTYNICFIGSASIFCLSWLYKIISSSHWISYRFLTSCALLFFLAAAITFISGILHLIYEHILWIRYINQTQTRKAGLICFIDIPTTIFTFGLFLTTTSIFRIGAALNATALVLPPAPNHERLLGIGLIYLALLLLAVLILFLHIRYRIQGVGALTILICLSVFMLIFATLAYGLCLFINHPIHPLMPTPTLTQAIYVEIYLLIFAVIAFFIYVCAVPCLHRGVVLNNNNIKTMHAFFQVILFFSALLASTYISLHYSVIHAIFISSCAVGIGSFLYDFVHDFWMYIDKVSPTDFLNQLAWPLITFIGFSYIIMASSLYNADSIISSTNHFAKTGLILYSIGFVLLLINALLKHRKIYHQPPQMSPAPNDFFHRWLYIPTHLPLNQLN